MSNFKNDTVDREIGEMLLGRKKTDDPNEKPSYYLKLTAKPELLKQLTTGTIIKLEAPDAKFIRMIKSGKLSPEQEEKARFQADNIPKFIVKRLVALIKK